MRKVVLAIRTPPIRVDLETKVDVR